MRMRYTTGDQVVVREMSPPGHVRTPGYCRGKRGIVERCCGAFANPERLAYGDYETPRIPMYRVRFAQTELWPDYQGPSIDQVEIEIYEHWLAPVEEG